MRLGPLRLPLGLWLCLQAGVDLWEMEVLLFPERGLIGGLDKIDYALADMMLVRVRIDAAFLMINTRD